ncbi:hypothetical protein [uncultured Litoreibacter sp.]|uniref:hypothetical protein n=1 Tax=uncultured Litoreibacter sp. TaxID=1392394 RepID=UPI0026052ACC|nr:hypothetical protein [uncultured Litoreibacter sp.]
MNLHWLIRAKRWAQNPPSAARVKLVFTIIAACIAIGLIEHYVGWPEWATAERIPRVPK